MKAIWKYQINSPGLFEIDMPKDSKLLTVQLQYGIPTVWVLVDTDTPIQRHLFCTIGTGHNAEEIFKNDMEYFGTVQMSEGVFHVFHSKSIGKFNASL